MSSQNDEQTEEFFDLMMSSYKMEMKPPREFKRDELKYFRSPIMIFASDDDVFFPAYKGISENNETVCRQANVLPYTRTSSSFGQNDVFGVQKDRKVFLGIIKMPQSF